MRHIVIGSFVGFVLAAAFLAACGGGGGGGAAPQGTEEDLQELQNQVGQILADLGQLRSDVDGLLGVVPTLAPAGTMSPYGGDVTAPPAGWLVCDGSAVSRAQYPALFAMIGTAWGEGDGSTTFNLPDLRGRFLRGVDGGTGRDPDAATRTASAPGGNAGALVGSAQDYATARPQDTDFSTDTAGAHQHLLNVGTAQITSAGVPLLNSGGNALDRLSGSAGAHSHTIDAGGDAETRPVNAAVWWVIKT